jgi:hypothetical protein
VFAEQSVSLDGFSTGPNVAVGNGMGDGGDRLHEWMFPADRSTDRIAEARKETFGTSGAVLTSFPVRLNLQERHLAASHHHGVFA